MERATRVEWGDILLSPQTVFTEFSQASPETGSANVWWCLEKK